MMDAWIVRHRAADFRREVRGGCGFPWFYGAVLLNETCCDVARYSVVPVVGTGREPVPIARYSRYFGYFGGYVCM